MGTELTKSSLLVVLWQNIFRVLDCNRTRSLIKTITWRTIGTLDTILIAYIVTGDIKQWSCYWWNGVIHEDDPVLFP